jgi:phospholipid/cholesterol/gamma-HCH transport system substrate-binding protein
MNNTQQTIRVGLFFLLGIALTWVTFEALSGGKVGPDEGYVVLAGFDTLKELKEGDQVRMAGVRIGNVMATQLAPSGTRAEALLRIDPRYSIRQDATAMIVMEGLIGTNYVSISLGTKGAPDLVSAEDRSRHRSWLARFTPGRTVDTSRLPEIRTASSSDLNAVMSQLGQLGQKLESSLNSLGNALAGDATNPGLIRKLDGLVTDNREKIGATMSNLQQISEKVNKGEGTLGRLISDATLHQELVASVRELRAGATEAKAFVANAQAIIDEVKRGKGPIGSLVFDHKAGEDIRASIANLRAVSDKISKGEGALGKLLSDDSLVRDIQAVVKKADRALDSMEDSGPITAAGAVANRLF